MHNSKYLIFVTDHSLSRKPSKNVRSCSDLLLTGNIYKDKKQGGRDGNKVSRNGFEIEIAKSLFIGTLKRSVVRLCGV